MKEFLKPTPGKVIPTVLLFMVSFVSILSIPGIQEPKFLIYVLSAPFFLFDYSKIISGLLVNIIYLLIELIYLYLILCLIVYVYHKMKTKSLNTK